MEKLIEYVQRVFEDKYWLDGGFQENTDGFVICAGGLDHESSNESSSGSSDESDSN